jgi:hypothetical protein
MKKLMAAALLLSLGGSQMGGCGSGGGGVFVSYVVVVNTTDQFTATLVGFDVDSTIDRTWVCTEPQANLTIGSSMFSGSVHIVVEDDNGDVVYDNIHSGNVGGVTVQTAPGGVPGVWRVFMDFDDAAWAGAIVLEADNPPTLDAISIGSGISNDDSLIFYASWDTTTVPVHVSMASGLSAGTVRVRLWDPDDPIGTPSFDMTINTGTGAVSQDIDTAAAAGTWMIQIDFTGCTLGGAISITN